MNGYIIVRINNTTKKKITEYFKSIGINKFIIYDQQYKDNINNVLNNKPSDTTVIFVNEKLRASKSIIKKHILAMYERIPKKININTIIQGIRLAGYGKHDALMFTDVISVQKHCRWEKSGYDIRYIPN